MSQREKQIGPRSATTVLAEQTHAMWQRHTLLGAMVIAGISVLAYLPSLHGGFIGDDYAFLTKAPYIQAPDGLYRIWFTTEPFEYYPISYSSFWLEWRLWGSNPVGYHVTNLLLHIAAALLIWKVLRKLAIGGAFLAALIFAVHPVNVESVAWIAQRRNVLAMLFFLLSMLWYIAAEQRRGRSDAGRASGVRTDSTRGVQDVDRAGLGVWYWLSLLAFVLAMLSKGSVAILPALLLGFVWWQRGKLTMRDVLRTAPFFLIAAALTWMNVWFQAKSSDGAIRMVGIDDRLAGAGTVVWFYLSKALLPLNLAFVYAQWKIQSGYLLWWAPLIVAIAVTVALWRMRNQLWGRAILLAWGYFCIALVPVMGLTDTGFMRYSLVADHYQYIAIIGVAALAGAGWDTWHRHGERASKVLSLAVATFAVTMLTVATLKQSMLYGEPIRLYEATLAENPDCWMVHNNLGRALAEVDRIDEEIAHYRRALKINPDLPEVHSNLAIALLKKGRIQESIEHCMSALKLNPQFSEAYIVLGDAYVESHRLSDAVEQYQQALRLDPQSCAAHVHLGNLYRKSGQLPVAIEQYQAALQLNPESPEAHNGLGNALKQADRLSEAARQYQEALRLKPDFAEAHNNLGSLLVNSGQISQAIEHYEQALRLKPNFSEAHFNLGNALVKADRPREAIDHFQIVLRLKPDDLEAAVNLMNACAQAGRAQEAIAAAERALELARMQGNLVVAEQIEAWLSTARSARQGVAH